LESELRKSKRAEQKLQALLFRLRQDVADVQQGADLMQKLQDQRALEYEVDFLTNKIKVTALLGVAAVPLFRHGVVCVVQPPEACGLIGNHVHSSGLPQAA